MLTWEFYSRTWLSLDVTRWLATACLRLYCSTPYGVVGWTYLEIDENPAAHPTTTTTTPESRVVLMNYMVEDPASSLHKHVLCRFIRNPCMYVHTSPPSAPKQAAGWPKHLPYSQPAESKHAAETLKRETIPSVRTGSLALGVPVLRWAASTHQSSNFGQYLDRMA